jgi:thymidylate kinase
MRSVLHCPNEETKPVGTQKSSIRKMLISRTHSTARPQNRTVDQAFTQGNRTRFVSFSGVDGAGKSTQIQFLTTSLKEAGLRVRSIAFWDEVATLTRLRERTGHSIFKGDKGVGTPEAPVERRDKNVRSRMMTMLRLCLYLFDAISTRRAVRRALKSGADVVIFDRYIYDELANLTLSNGLVCAYIRMIMKVVPRPHVSYFLDADPPLARARKPEYPLEFIYLNRRSYLQLSSLIGGITLIEPMPIPDVQRQVLDHARRILPTTAC